MPQTKVSPWTIWGRSLPPRVDRLLDHPWVRCSMHAVAIVVHRGWYMGLGAVVITLVYANIIPPMLEKDCHLVASPALAEALAQEGIVPTGMPVLDQLSLPRMEGLGDRHARNAAATYETVWMVCERAQRKDLVPKATQERP